MLQFILYFLVKGYGYFPQAGSATNGASCGLDCQSVCCQVCLGQDGNSRAMIAMVVRAFMLVVAVFLSAVTARPDSAGIVEMVNGLAYGGIPYGSVTGQVADYYRQNGNLDLGKTLYDDFLTYSNVIAG